MRSPHPRPRWPANASARPQGGSDVPPASATQGGGHGGHGPGSHGHTAHAHRGRQPPSPAYDEPYRPQFHFTLPNSWLGDPNGLTYRDGRYHLYSYGTWEGATSPDLVHWSDIPVTAPQRDPGSSAFYSGSAVVDKDNTSGFGTPGSPAMVAVFTSQMANGDQAQSLAYSTDNGKTWTRYAGNPVLDLKSQNFRDPKVFWYAPMHSWIMAIALSDQHKVAFYRSPDLKTWTHLSDFGPAGSTSGVWEMPDLYQLPVDGNPRTPSGS
ncbi:glycoside hydrolase family 32 protein [Sinomonas atrocyanea]